MQECVYALLHNDTRYWLINSSEAYEQGNRNDLVWTVATPAGSIVNKALFYLMKPAMLHPTSLRVITAA